MNRIIHGDCLTVLPKLPPAKCVFADPPDNLGQKYNGFEDKWPSMQAYHDWLLKVLEAAAWNDPSLIWISTYYRHQAPLGSMAEFMARESSILPVWEPRWFYWHFTFGEQQERDFKNCHRPILRLMKPDAKVYPEAVKEQSQRQRNGDKRAKEGGCVPGDIWTFPRVCGTFKERRKWIPNQHPEALLERIVKFSAKPGDLVIDLCGGSFTTARVCQRLGIDCISIEISEFHCRQGAEELGVEVEVL